MKLKLLAGGLLLALAACGSSGGGKAAFVNACMDEGGESKEVCTCMADSIEKSLDKGTFSKLSKAMAAGEEKGSKMMEDMSEAEQTAIGGAMLTAGFACAMGG